MVKRQEFSNALVEREPGVLNGIEIGRVRRQEFLSAAGVFNQGPDFGGLMEAGIIIDHNLSRFKSGHQTVLDIGLEERGVTGPLKHKRGEEGLVVEGINQTDALRAMARLLAPTRFPLRTPAVGTGVRVIHARLIQVHDLLGGNPRQLLAKLLPQCFVALGIAEGLFLCV